MKLKNGLTYYYITAGNSNERECSEIMKNMMEDNLKLNWRDLPEILRKVGLVSDEYELSDFKLESNRKVVFSVKTQLESATVEFMLGDMVNPNAKVKVIKENEGEKIYYISRVIEVQSENEIM